MAPSRYVLSRTGSHRGTRLGGPAGYTNLPVDSHGVPVADHPTLRVGESHVFVAGDANNHLPLLHEASDEGRIAGDNAGRHPDIRPGLRRTPPNVLFSDPQFAMTGKTFAELEGRDYVVGEVSFDNQGRSRVMLRNEGLLRINASRRDGLLLGAEMVGPRAEHLAHLLAWSQQSGLSVADMLAMPFYHPVVEEGLRTALRDACQKLDDCTLEAA